MKSNYDELKNTQFISDLKITHEISGNKIEIKEKILRVSTLGKTFARICLKSTHNI